MLIYVNHDFNGSLRHSDNLITYLGTTLTSIVTTYRSYQHQNTSCKKAYYGLQSSGVCCDGVTPKTLCHIYKVGCQPILTYGCSAVNIDHKSVKCMDSVQAMLIKTALGLPKNCRNSSPLAALGIEKIEQLIKRQQLSLLRDSRDTVTQRLEHFTLK